MRGDLERLLDALKAIEHIERYTRRGEAAFRADEFIQAMWTSSKTAAARDLGPLKARVRWMLTDIDAG